MLVDLVFLAARPPRHEPNVALPGDTVTDRMVGTVFSDKLMLADWPALGPCSLLTPQPARAAVRGMSYQDLLRDADFTRAVKTIAEQCSVNVDIARLKCQGG